MSEFQTLTLLMSQLNNNNQICQLQHSAFIHSFVCLYVILFYLSTTTTMPPKSPSKKATAKWNIAKTEALIPFLQSKSSWIEGTSFKEGSFTAAADHIKDLHTDGAIKMAAYCRTKWSSVSFSYHQ